MEKLYDIAIIGAGPAGSMLTRLIQDKYKIALFDTRPLDRPYQFGDPLKSCGGLIAPDAQKFLKQQKMSVPANITDQEQSPYVATIDFDIGITRNFKRNYINVDREAFDRWLLSDLKADTYFDKRIKSIKETEDGFLIDDTIKAKVLVGADGAMSYVRRKFFPSFKTRTYTSIQHVFAKELIKGMQCYFDTGISDYYGWALNKNGKTYLGWAIPEGKGAKEKFSNFKSKNGFSESMSEEGTIILRPKFFHPITCSKNIFLIGEAGGYISPSSAEGISYAFKTAKILAESRFEEKRFRFKMLRIKMNLFYKNLKGIFMYTPWIRHMIMKLSFWK